MSQPPKEPQHPEQKPPEFRFRTKPVQERTIWESYAVLPARTRLYVSLGITAFAAIGLYVSDQLEKSYPVPNPAPKEDVDASRSTRSPTPSSS
ncbi:hypothetical protein ONZ51_g12260 [Trametes cubensis]|uniref:Uncharacterized protein n=1 Tax=Trametes cubensis TaxID=1111947 RepID=A0AAD7TG84_9APHY|nr:hypothetical protein ONZ51_g12260 [Trametes cubensis]